MDALALPVSVASGAGRLLIHAEGLRGRHLDSPLRRLLALLAPDARRRQPLNVQVDDLRGRCLLCVQDAGPLIDLPLPAGTYRVSATLGPVCRSYTLTLEPGAALDLRLRPAPEAA